MNISEIAERFKVFAARECKGSSKLYEDLSMNIAEDLALLQMAAHTRPGQPIPNLFLGAVHYLLLKEKNHELVEYYGSIVARPKESASAFPRFKDFCRQHEKEMIEMLKAKLVQTNEVRRCAYLYPSFCRIYDIANRPLALIEIGTSAGLQLLWDQYAYTYDSKEIYGSNDQYRSNKLYGNPNSELKLHGQMRGDSTPNLHIKSPPVTTRIGIDLHVNNLNDPEDYLWLKSLIWPEHHERITNFEDAFSCLQNHSLELIEGNGIKLLTPAASNIPLTSAICIFHTHVANQLSKEDKLELLDHIRKLGEARDVFHLYNNIWDLDLHLDYYLDGEEYKETLAGTDGHGRWFQWH